jgi:hypothetical protein
MRLAGSKGSADEPHVHVLSSVLEPPTTPYLPVCRGAGWWVPEGRLGGAEGGASDEALYRAILAQMSTPWAPERRANHARWALGEAVRLLRRHGATYAAARSALQRGDALAATVRAMEAALDADQAAVAAGGGGGESRVG